MTDNEIIKALEEHIERTKNIKYGARKMATVDVKLLKDTLDIINRQKANAEGLINAVKFLNEKVSSAKTEAVEEFAERLKEKCRQARYSIKVTSELSEDITLVLKESDKLQVIDENDIDNALKELL